MKFLVLLFSDSNEFQSQKIFPAGGGQKKSARERSMEWAAALEFEGAQKEVAVLEGKGWTSGRLINEISAAAKNAAADFVVYADASAAFLDLPLSKKLIQDHVEYKAEYTFADGYPAGFAPEIIDSGAAAIMASLCQSASAAEAQKPVCAQSVFNIIKGDVNSFEIETEIASVDYRLLRLDFLCASRQSALAAQALAEKLAAAGKQGLLELDGQSLGDKNVLEICKEAAAEIQVLKTVPAFYNVQIEGRAAGKFRFSPCEPKDERMPFEKFEALVKKISDFSGAATIGLSLFGEAALHPDFDKFVLCALQAGHKIFVEVDGGSLPEFIKGGAFERLNASALLDGEARSKIYFAVCLDAQSQETFSLFHQGSLQAALAAVQSLSAAFPQTYPQLVRVAENEGDLEAFYRFWSDKNSPSGGKIIVQKYDHFCGRLPQKKPADLSPLERTPCWHLRRDFDVLLDGSVPLCRDRFDSEILGNAFSDSLSEIWQKKNSLLGEHVQNKFNALCGNCDEWYTFNF